MTVGMIAPLINSKISTHTITTALTQHHV